MKGWLHIPERAHWLSLLFVSQCHLCVDVPTDAQGMHISDLLKLSQIKSLPFPK